MKQTFLSSSTGKASCWLALVLLAACGGGGGDATNANGGTTKPSLVRVEFGRLVDIYAYQRIDVSRADRRDRFNRKPVLIERDVVINSSIETQTLIDAGGDEVVDANYEFMPFDKSVGHSELVILWDDRDAVERDKFTSAQANAKAGLAELAPSYRGQNTSTRPIISAAKWRAWRPPTSAALAPRPPPPPRAPRAWCR